MTNRKLHHDDDLIRILVKKLQFQVGVTIPSHVLRNGSFIERTDYLANGLTYQFRSYLAGTRRQSESVEETVRVPLTWVDHLKERFAPRWMLDRWPIKWRVIEVKRVVSITNICPHIEVPNDDQRHFEVLMIDNIPDLSRYGKEIFNSARELPKDSQ